MTEITFNPGGYEVYPGCRAPDFAREFIESKRVTLDSFCMNERIDPREVPRLIGEILTEWELTEAWHPSRREAAAHLINHLRIKISNERRDNAGPGQSGSSGRGRHRNPTAYDIARDLLGESSG